MTESTHPISVAPERRTFLKKTAAVVIGAIATLIPGAAGLAVLFDPIRRKSAVLGFVRVATLDAVPTDGSARKFSITADKTDAWNKFPNAPIGAVYLHRKGEQVIAFNTKCPHAGCFVDAVSGGGFACPCHNSRFNVDGSLVPGSVSPRGLDELEVDAEALKQGIVQVRFQNFTTGTHEKIVAS